MPSSQYRALNGREIREIIKLRLNKEVDSLPYMREGNSFHNVNVQLGIVITAYPADVPVPSLDINFDVPSKDFSEVESAIKQIEKAEDLAREAEKLDELMVRVEELQGKILELRNTLVFESESEQEFNGNQPDRTRVENNLPVTVEKIEHGKKTEVKVNPVEFKKMAKL